MKSKLNTLDTYLKVYVQLAMPRALASCCINSSALGQDWLNKNSCLESHKARLNYSSLVYCRVWLVVCIPSSFRFTTPSHPTSPLPSHIIYTLVPNSHHPTSPLPSQTSTLPPLLPSLPTPPPFPPPSPIPSLPPSPHTISLCSSGMRSIL